MNDIATRVDSLEAAVLGLARVELGDHPGHPFRGNQYKGGEEGASGEEAERKANAAADERVRNYEIMHGTSKAIDKGVRTRNSGFAELPSIKQMRDTAKAEYGHIKQDDPARISQAAVKAQNAGNEVLYRALRAEEREARKGLRNMRAYGLAASLVELGDSEGHPFRGNQYTPGGGGKESDGFPELRHVNAGTSRPGKGADIVRFPRGREYLSGLEKGARTLSAGQVRQLKTGDPVAVWINGRAHPAEVISNTDNFKGNPRLDVSYYPERPPSSAPSEKPDDYRYGILRGLANVGEHDVYNIDALASEVKAQMPSLDERNAQRERLHSIAASLDISPGEWTEFTLEDEDVYTLTASGVLTPSVEQRITDIELAVVGLASVEFGDVEGHPFHGNQWTDGVPTDAGGRPITEGMAKGVTDAAVKSQRLIEAKTKAQEMRATAERAEPAMTAALERIAQAARGEMVGLEHKLKTEESLERKLNLKATEKGISIDAAADGIHDALRYTLAAPAAELPAAASRALSELRDQGATIKDADVENYFARGDTYNGINATGVTADGTKFELQFHTPESAVLKEENGPLHPLYREYRKLETPPEEKATLFAQMTTISDAIPQPPATIFTIGTPVVRSFNLETGKEERNTPTPVLVRASSEL